MPLKPRSVPVSLHFDLHLLHNTETNKKMTALLRSFIFTTQVLLK